MNDLVDTKILKKYEIMQKIGKGAYGQVWKAKNKKNKCVCAVKKVFDAFRNSTDCQRTYRQVMYLRELNHPHIIKLVDYYQASNGRDLYIEMQFVESDLSTVIKNGCLKGIHKEYIFTQIVSAMHYIHSGNLIHRDIKPSNILIGANCETKICDFGLIRSVNQVDHSLTDNIATRWYKAPELLLSSNNYGKEVDIWSLGCILGEMYLGKPIFQGTSTFNQLQKIIEVTGKPTNIDSIIQSQTSKAVLNSFQLKIKARPIHEIFPTLDSIVCDLLTAIFQFDPRSRPTLQSIIEHPYFDKYRNKVPFPKLLKNITIQNDDKKLSVEEYKALLINPNDIEEFGPTIEAKKMPKFCSFNFHSQQNIQKNIPKIFSPANGVMEEKEKEGESKKIGMQIIHNHQKRQDRQNISPGSEYSGTSIKSIKSNNNKVSIYKKHKIMETNNKSTKSAKNFPNSPLEPKNARMSGQDKKMDNKFTPTAMKSKGCYSDIGKKDKTIKREEQAGNNIKSFVPKAVKHLTPPAKHPTLNSKPNHSPIALQKRESETEAVSLKKEEPKIPLIGSSASPTGYKFITKKQSELMKPAAIKYTGKTTVYRAGGLRHS